MSRQRDWQRKMRELGRCEQCGVEATARVCGGCRDKHRLAVRRHYARHYKRRKGPA